MSLDARSGQVSSSGAQSQGASHAPTPPRNSRVDHVYLFLFQAVTAAAEAPLAAAPALASVAGPPQLVARRHTTADPVLHPVRAAPYWEARTFAAVSDRHFVT